MSGYTDDPELVALARAIFSERIPFNGSLGLEVEHIGPDRVSLGFDMEDRFVGNFMRRILHGGVISAVLDATAGLVAFLGVARRMDPATSIEDKLERFSRIGTIDLRIDYLRPGVGERFTASAETLRAGRRIAVIRMDLHNEKGEHIATGTCAYIVG